MVAHLVWDQDAAGSNPVSPTDAEWDYTNRQSTLPVGPSVSLLIDMSYGKLEFFMQILQILAFGGDKN